jgi:hypothetical protein
VTDEEMDKLGDVEDEERAAFDVVADTLELIEDELLLAKTDVVSYADRVSRTPEFVVDEAVEGAAEAFKVEFGPCARKATTESEAAEEVLPNWFLKWQVPADVPSKLKPTQPGVTSQTVKQAAKPPP